MWQYKLWENISCGKSENPARAEVEGTPPKRSSRCKKNVKNKLWKPAKPGSRKSRGSNSHNFFYIVNHVLRGYPRLPRAPDFPTFNNVFCFTTYFSCIPSIFGAYIVIHVHNLFFSQLIFFGRRPSIFSSRRNPDFSQLIFFHNLFFSQLIFASGL